MKSNIQRIKIYNAFTLQIEEVDKVIKTDEEWRKILTPEQFRIMREKGTELPKKGICEIPNKIGIYECVGCGTALFNVNRKFDSQTGWLSFWEPLSELNIAFKDDTGFGMRRTEVICARCDAHLGHVFDDGPPPTGKRYCINSVALKFVPLNSERTQKAIFAAGCFWGVEEKFRRLKGVLSTRVGYTGGRTKNPTYEDVCSDKTGHVEAVEIEFDPEKISYAELLEFFFKIHDPAQFNRQGPDTGSQYRSVIFYTTPEQESLAKAYKKKLNESGVFTNPIATDIRPASKFYEAEEYHQKYIQRKGRCSF